MKKLYIILLLIPFFGYSQIFVDQDATGMNNGSSWINAYSDLQDAILNAPAGANVWIAEGTYLPSTNGSIDSSFKLTQSIELYGGFNGNETDLTQRNYEANLTIISGDYNNDDDIVVNTNPLSISYNNYTENAKRIITAIDVTGSIVIDGITVSGGHNSSANAMYFIPDDSLSVLVKNCIVKNNKSVSSGPIFITSAVNEKISFRFENSSAINNYSSSKGGAVFITGSGETIVDFVNVLFHQNYTSNRAGAVNMEGNVTPTFQNCIFSENRANNGGAIFELQSGQSTYENCTFYKNTAGSQASVIFNYNSLKAKLQNCIFYANGTNNPLYGGGNFEIGSSVIEYNSWTDYSSSGGSNSIDLGGNLYNINPQFIDESTYDFNLASTSPMINVGNNAVVQATNDNSGYISRIVDATVDLGAFEYHLPFNSNVVADNFVCFGSDNGTAMLTADNYAPFNYVWNNASVQGDNPTNLSAGNYEVKVINAIGDFEVSNFTINENPEILTTASQTLPSSGGSDGIAAVNVSGGTSPFTYEWNTNPIQTTDNVTGLSENSYNVTITDAESCTKSVIFDFSIPNSIINIEDSKEINVGPNPTIENIRITFSGDLLDKNSLSEVIIYNTSGKLVYNENLLIQKSSLIDLTHLSSGLYILELKQKEMHFRKLIIKE